MSPPEKKTVHKFGSSPWLPLVFLLCAFVTSECLLPLSTAVELGADEGFELGKAVSWMHGQKLYSEVWNDQPPLHTWLIVKVLRHISHSIFAARLVTVVFACLLLSAFYTICLRIHGVAVAAIGTVLLVGSPAFLELSSSCMLEIPALATALSGLAVLLTASHNRWRIREIACGILFGAALQIKLVPMTLLPLAAVIVWSRSPAERNRVWHAATPLGTIAAAMVASYIGTDFIIEGGAYLKNLQQPWSSHFGNARSTEYGSAAEHPFNWMLLPKNWDTAAAAIVGIAVLFRSLAIAFRRTPQNPNSKIQKHVESREKNRMGDTQPEARGLACRDFDVGIWTSAELPLVWLLIAFIVFPFHRPWWSYYWIHSALPLSLCAGIGFVALWRRVLIKRSIISVTMLLIFSFCAAAWVGGRLYLQVNGIRQTPRVFAQPVLDVLARLKPFSRCIYAEREIYSFYADLPMPAQLTVVPLKRLWSGEMTSDRLARELESSDPSIMLLNNDGQARPFQELLDTRYQLVYMDGEHRLYAKRNIAAKALP